MNKVVAIIQSNYIPWKGYFDIINSVDEFIIYDDLQYTRRDWRNRNLIKTAQGLTWLTIPVVVKGKYQQTISETLVSDKKWAEKHWKSISHTYGKSEYFRDYSDQLEHLYLEKAPLLDRLSEINHLFLSEINQILGIKTRLRWSDEFDVSGRKTDRLLAICKATGASHYVSGPAAKSYLDQALMEQEGIQVQWINYTDYPVYPQLHGDFEHGVSILDLLFNTGSNAHKYMTSFTD